MEETDVEREGEGAGRVMMDGEGKLKVGGV